jgi:hypothetical protein
MGGAMNKVLWFVLVAGCADPADTPRLQTYGALFPTCIIACKATVTSADLDGGSSQNISTTASVEKATQ